ncbi:MAG TPA: hypothetical protein VFF50_09665 [Candidatus Deferrimicrobiaceae bacterium]|nr:hypothetical protein [Candidatus Deferrimicrobiaceae bacterium]
MRLNRRSAVMDVTAAACGSLVTNIVQWPDDSSHMVGIIYDGSIDLLIVQ